MKKFLILVAIVLAAGCATRGKSTKIPGKTVELGKGSFKLPPIHTDTLGNGLQLVIIEDNRLPVVNLTLHFRTGTSSDPADKAGLTDLMVSMLTKGTKNRTAKQIAEEIDFVGGSLAASASRDTSQVGVRVLKKDLAVGLDLLRDVVMHPTFPADQLSVLKNQARGSVKQRFQDPRSLATYHARYLVFGDQHPYGFAASERSVSGIGKADLQGQFNRNIVPSQAILIIAGDVERDTIHRKLKMAFGPWDKASAKLPTVPAPPPTKRIVRLVDKPDLTQSSIIIAHRGPARSTEDYLAIRLMNYTLGGGGFSSRLMKSVRSEGGKTYGVGSTFTMNKHGGLFAVTTSTRTKETLATIELILGELENVRSNGITASELSSAQSQMVGSFPLKMETIAAVAGNVFNVLYHDLTFEYLTHYRENVAGVTAEAAAAAATAHLHPDNTVIVVVGNAKLIQADLEKKFGSVEVVKFLEYAHTVDRSS